MLDISDVLRAAQRLLDQPENSAQRRDMAASLGAHACDPRVSKEQAGEALAAAVQLLTM